MNELNLNTLYIKNMVCDRCIHTVKADLEKLGLDYHTVQLGKVELNNPLNDEQKQQLSAILTEQGFELLQNKNSQLLEDIKTKLREWVSATNRPNVNLSTYLSDALGYDYSHLSSLFSSVEGITIEKYLILLKIERVKELMFYDQLNISEIAYQLGYSSVQHLSNQFKKETGLTPSQWKKLQVNDRIGIDQVGKKK